MGDTRTIKKKMVDKGRSDFVNYAAEILGISKQWASVKMAGKSDFTRGELAALTKELGLTPEELQEIVTMEKE